MTSEMKMRMKFVAVWCAGFVVGCGSDDGPDSPDASPPDNLIAMSLSTTVPAGGEVFRCKYMPMPAGDRDIIRFEHDYTPGSHHILLYPTSLTAAQAAAEPGDFDCLSRGNLGQTGLAYGASETPTGSQTYPEGVGLKLASEQVMLLEAHYLNATDRELEASVTVRMFSSENPVTTAAGNLFFYNYAIMIPPAPGEATSAMACDIPAPINLQFASSHMHRRGTFYTSSVVSPLGSRQALHETSDWESAEPAVFEPVLPIEAGSRIEFACDFENDLPQVVTEGESAETNEMCMFIASYWPQQSAAIEACIGGESGPLLDGDATCIETIDCLGGASTDVATQQCLAQNCRPSSPALNSLVFCLDESGCATETCIEQNCLSEYLACEAAGCDAS